MTEYKPPATELVPYKFNKIAELREAVTVNLEDHGDFELHRDGIVRAVLERIARGNCYAPSWAKEALKLYASSGEQK